MHFVYVRIKQIQDSFVNVKILFTVLPFVNRDILSIRKSVNLPKTAKTKLKSVKYQYCRLLSMKKNLKYLRERYRY